MSEPRIASIVRYPVKGLPGVVAGGAVALEPGRGLRWDRSHAIENGRVRIEAPAAWNSREGYFHVARHEEIVRFGVVLDDAEGDAPTLTLTAPDGRSASGALGEAVGDGAPGEATDKTSDHATDEDGAIGALLRDTLPAGAFGSPRLIRSGATGLWDWPEAHLSFINLATVRALEEAAGAPVDPRRFRGNMLLGDLPAWGELGLLGRRFRIGGAVLEFFQPTDRCRATTIDPVAGVSDLNVPGLLASRFGHMYCGVYARVVSAGAVRAGDRLEALDGGTRSTRVDGEPGWPRTGRIVSREPAGARSESFWIEDPTGLVGAALPGQHLRVHLADEAAPSWRSYTISATSPGRARITVRRDGRISSALHDRAVVGSGLVLSGPFGDVTLDVARTADSGTATAPRPGTPGADTPAPDSRGERDLVLVSAGSGITPTVAMLHALVVAGSRRRVRVLHVERTAADLALWDEVTGACAALPDAGAALHLSRAAESSPTSGSAPSPADTRIGRPTAEDVLATIADIDPSSVDVFVCGPALFTAEVRLTLEGAGVPAENVRAEVFYSPTAAELAEPRDPSSAGPHRIRVGTAEARWRPASGSILDAVEGVGQDWPSGCRVGACGTCVRRLVSGSIEYLVDPIVPPPAGSVLVCCSAPTSDVEFAAEV
ncbi:MOSC domain-containing protein [Labedella endophytica]|uniref:MOSC domain-containing protein n=1 Tax=Labedella endophytica TaxID=1523160 RepID=A0A3S0VBN1_9MICO|nr:MOSC domain-containing protein [Labedella endophytica]RUR01692.1 MOSC domain-containing protein [Labedella endophytica]